MTDLHHTPIVDLTLLYDQQTSNFYIYITKVCLPELPDVRCIVLKGLLHPSSGARHQLQCCTTKIKRPPHSLYVDVNQVLTFASLPAYDLGDRGVEIRLYAQTLWTHRRRRLAVGSIPLCTMNLIHQMDRRILHLTLNSSIDYAEIYAEHELNLLRARQLSLIPSPFSSATAVNGIGGSSRGDTAPQVELSVKWHTVELDYATERKVSLMLWKYRRMHRVGKHASFTAYLRETRRGSVLDLVTFQHKVVLPTATQYVGATADSPHMLMFEAVELNCRDFALEELSIVLQVGREKKSSGQKMSAAVTGCHAPVEKAACAHLHLRLDASTECPETVYWRNFIAQPMESAPKQWFAMNMSEFFIQSGHK